MRTLALLHHCAFHLSFRDTSVSWIVRHIVFPALKDKIKGKKSDARQ
jgi:hypothetical protein